jgi:hypothetical protein
MYRLIDAIGVSRISRVSRISHAVRICAALMICCLAGTTSVRAQATATLTGTVVDESGAVMANAVVVATSLATMLDRQTATSREGQFTVPLLTPGRYIVRVQRDGFTPIEVPELVLNVNDTVAIRVQMKVAAVGESVNVVPEPPRINTSPGVSTVIDRQRMESLPMLNRSTLSLAELVPGVSGVTLPQAVTDQRAGPTISAAGSRSDQVNVQLDGAQFAASLLNTVQNLPSPDSIQEFRVLTNSYSAEYGRASGATLLAITKSGTQTLRGGLWEYVRNDALNATNFFAPAKPALRQNQFGGNLGGPLLRDRTFFFASYEGLQIREQAIVRYSPPTAAQRAGDFSASSVPILDPDTGRPFPGNQIPRERLDPMALNFLDAYVPLPNQGTQLNTLASRPTDGNQFTVKIDHQLASSNTATVRWFRSNTEGTRLAGLEALNTPQQNLVNSWTLSDTHIFRANLVGEGRVSFTTIETSSPTAPGSRSPRELGALFDQDGASPQAPNVNVSGAFASSTILPWLERSRLSGFDYKLSWVAGGHAVKLGVQYLRQSQLERGPYQSSGTFGFTGGFTGSPIADFMIGRPGSFVQAGLTDRLATSHPWSAFLQDDVRLGRVTANVGLRVDRFVSWEQTGGRAAIFRPGQQSTRFPTAPPGLVTPGDAGVPDGLVPPRSDFSPRVGFAWDVSGDGRTAVRAAYGRFITVGPSIGTTQVNGNAPFTPTVSLVPQSFRDPYGNGRSVFPLVQGDALFPVPMQILSIAEDFGPGHVDQFNVALQRQFGPHLGVQAGYVGSRGRDLMGDRQINAPVFGPGATIANAQQRRPLLPQFYGSISEKVSDQRSQYDSLQISATKAYADGYTFQLAYTLSRSMDDGSGPVATGPQNPAAPRAEWARSDFDRRHVLRLNGMWEAPRMQTGPAVVRHLVGGWRLAGIMSALSGAPFTVTSGADDALIGPNRGLAAQRPDLAGEPALDSGRSRDDRIARYFNTGAFVRPAPGQFGNAGRNLLTGPGAFTVDASMAKQFPLWPGAPDRHVELRVEVFNLFNTVNLGSPVANMASSSFGRIESAGQARVIQLGFRAAF